MEKFASKYFIWIFLKGGSNKAHAPWVLHRFKKNHREKPALWLSYKDYILTDFENGGILNSTPYIFFNGKENEYLNKFKVSR